MKRFLALLLSIALMLTLLAACGGGGEDKTTGKDSAQTEDKEDKPSEDDSKESKDDGETGGLLFDEPVTLSMMFYSHPSYPYQEDWYIVKAIEERTNVKIAAEAVGEGLGEKISLDMASGELPDMTYLSVGEAQKYGADGAYVNILDHIDKLPNFKKWKEEH